MERNGIEIEKYIIRSAETNILVNASNKKILVIGDGCKDVFQYGKCERLSPEAPVPIFLPTKNNYNGGMAINVYNNLIALGIDCDIITESGTTKTRYVDEVSNQMLIRIDENDKIDRISSDTIKNIEFDCYNAIIISDYNKGFLTEDDIYFISENHSTVFLDSKKNFKTWADKIKFVKINESEYNKNKRYFIHYFNFMERNLIVTKGKYGAVLNHLEDFLIADEHPVRDLSGAGDTFLAALAAKYIENYDIREAIRFANKCASWVVTQKGVVVVDKNKI